MKKKILLHIIVVVLLFQGCTLFPVEKEIIYEGSYQEKTIRIYYIPGNATAQNVMQICLIPEGGWERVVANYERYNRVLSVDTLPDSLRIIAMDSSSYFPHSPDTLYISKKILE